MTLTGALLVGVGAALAFTGVQLYVVKEAYDAQTKEYRVLLQELDVLRKENELNIAAVSRLQIEKQSLQESYNVQQKAVVQLLQGSPAFRDWATDGIDVDLLRGLFRTDGSSPDNSGSTGRPDGRSAPATSGNGGPNGKD